MNMDPKCKYDEATEIKGALARNDAGDLALKLGKDAVMLQARVNIALEICFFKQLLHTYIWLKMILIGHIKVIIIANLPFSLIYEIFSHFIYFAILTLPIQYIRKLASFK